MFCYLGVNLMFFTTHLVLNIRIGPTIASNVILNRNILRKGIALTCNVAYIVKTCGTETCFQNCSMNTVYL